MFRKLVTLMILAALAAPAVSHAEGNYSADRTPAAAKHKKGKAKKAKAGKGKKKAAKAAHHAKAKAKGKKGTHAPKHEAVGGSADGISHTPPAEAAPKDDLPAPTTDTGAQH